MGFKRLIQVRIYQRGCGSAPVAHSRVNSAAQSRLNGRQYTAGHGRRGEWVWIRGIFNRPPTSLTHHSLARERSGAERSRGGIGSRLAHLSAASRSVFSPGCRLKGVACLDSARSTATRRRGKARLFAALETVLKPSPSDEVTISLVGVDNSRNQGEP